MPKALRSLCMLISIKCLFITGTLFILKMLIFEVFSCEVMSSEGFAKQWKIKIICC